MKTNELIRFLLVSLVLVAVVAACGEPGPAAETPAGEATPTAAVSPAAETPAVEMSPTAAVSPAPPAELGGEELLQDRCTQCHGLDRVRTQAKTLDEWEHEVAEMRELGAQLTDAEAQVLVEYLAETYGP